MRSTGTDPEHSTADAQQTTITALRASSDAVDALQDTAAEFDIEPSCIEQLTASFISSYWTYTYEEALLPTEPTEALWYIIQSINAAAQERGERFQKALQTIDLSEAGRRAGCVAALKAGGAPLYTRDELAAVTVSFSEHASDIKNRLHLLQIGYPFRPFRDAECFSTQLDCLYPVHCPHIRIEGRDETGKKQSQLIWPYPEGESPFNPGCAAIYEQAGRQSIHRTGAALLGLEESAAVKVVELRATALQVKLSMLARIRESLESLNAEFLLDELIHTIFKSLNKARREVLIDADRRLYGLDPFAPENLKKRYSIQPGGLTPTLLFALHAEHELRCGAFHKLRSFIQRNGPLPWNYFELLDLGTCASLDRAIDTFQEDFGDLLAKERRVLPDVLETLLRPHIPSDWTLSTALVSASGVQSSDDYRCIRWGSFHDATGQSRTRCPHLARTAWTGHSH